MNKTKWILALCVAALALFYFYPAPRTSFDRAFAQVEPGLAADLLAFRNEHPPRRLRVDGLEWRYFAGGRAPGAADTILFLHGMTGARDIWWRQIRALSGAYHIVAVTYPAADGLAAMERGVLAILERERVSRFHVVGSSLGGYFAQYLVARHGSRIRSAVFANTFPPNELIARKNRVVGTALPYLPEWLIMRVFAASLREKVYPAAGRSELVLAYGLEQTHGRMSKAQIVARFHSVVDPFVAPDPTAQGIPVLIVEAANDPLVEAELRRRMKSTYPAAQVHTFPDAGHFPYLNEAAAYTDLLREFLSGAR